VPPPGRATAASPGTPGGSGVQGLFWGVAAGDGSRKWAQDQKLELPYLEGVTTAGTEIRPHRPSGRGDLTCPIRAAAVGLPPTAATARAGASCGFAVTDGRVPAAPAPAIGAVSPGR
jgi:hypothetical protein